MSLLKNRFLPSGLYSMLFQYIWRKRTVCFGRQRQSISSSNPSRFCAALAGTATANLVPLTFHCDHSIVIHTNTGQPKAMSDQSRVIVDNLEMLTQKQQPSSGEQSQQEHQQQQKQHKLVVGWDANKNSTLLVVATLITTLTYQIGCNPPGGFWQESGKDKNGKEHEAGAPIMRDLYPERYWLFMTAAWVGFGDSMLLTLWLLGNAPVSSRRVRWSFIVAYSSLQLTYISAMFGTSLIIDLATWAGVMIFLTFVVGLEKEGQNFMVHHSPCCGKLWH